MNELTKDQKKTFRKKSEEHWKFIEKIAIFPIRKKKAKKLYIEAMLHGYKHAVFDFPSNSGNKMQKQEEKK